MQTTSASPQTTLPPLRAVREARGLGLRHVAGEAGIDPSHLSRVERGEASLSVDALLRLAHVLGLRELARFIAPYANRGPAGELDLGERSAGRSRHEES